MFGDGIGVFTNRLTVPTRDKGKSSGNVLNFDIHRCWIKKIEPAPG